MISRNVMMVCVMAFLSPCMAFTAAETNSVLQRILHRMKISGDHDDWSAVEENPCEVVSNMDEFLSQVNCPGWNLNDKRQVFDWYLSTLAVGDIRIMQNRDKSQASLVLAHCYDLSYTNAAPYYRQLALNPHGVSRGDAMRLYLKSVGVGSEATSFTELIMTNLHGNASHERFQAIRAYSDMIFKRLDTGTSVSPEIGMFFKNRNLDVTGAMTIDRLLVAGCEGYAYSSNRLATCHFVLDNTNTTRRMDAYFIAITNQLLSSGRPLQWINIGGANE